jgi:hypothetical protein
MITSVYNEVIHRLEAIEAINFLNMYEEYLHNLRMKLL